MCPRQVKNRTVLNSADHTAYRFATMRLCHLALDRLDLQFPSKEHSRWMQAPTGGNLMALKRVARYLIGRGRSIQKFVRQVEDPSDVVVCTDSDHAGCLISRKLLAILLKSGPSSQSALPLSRAAGDDDSLADIVGGADDSGDVCDCRDLYRRRRQH